MIDLLRNRIKRAQPSLRDDGIVLRPGDLLRVTFR